MQEDIEVLRAAHLPDVPERDMPVVPRKKRTGAMCAREP